ncbi:hypothetical protein C8R48DRAFT_672105 [Suillus tomentosus]|nr:hypothetical protein C8R48DRAFT_672105 [Suillus tomentosus]
MASHCVHFTPPMSPIDFRCKKLIKNGGGNFVPIADWVPLKMNKSKFDGMKIQNKPGDPEYPYNRGFAGANDTPCFKINWWDSSETTGQSDGVNTEASYDLGWDSAPDAGDLHPGETPGESVEVDLKVTYDLGWDSAPALHSDLPSETMEPLTVDSIDIDDEYDLGWNRAPTLHSDSPPKIMEPSTVDSIDIDDEYDLRWDDAVDDDHQSCNPIDIYEAYDLRWNDSASMDDEDANASAASVPSISRSKTSNSTPDAILHVEAAMMQALWRLNAFGHTNDGRSRSRTVPWSLASEESQFQIVRCIQRDEKLGDQVGRGHPLNHPPDTYVQCHNGSAGHFSEGP